MKKLNLLSFLLMMMTVLSLVVVSSCTKEGPQGPAGQDGEDGIDGTDGTATCGVCHNFSEELTSRIAQYNNSVHATGIASFEGENVACAPCHTSKGFREILETGGPNTAAPIENPTQPNCYTCHNIHQTYTGADLALATEAAVTWRFDGQVFDHGKGNLCANCHQFRAINPYPDINNLEGTVTFTSKRYGPHHGPQSQLLAGKSGFEIGSGYPTSQHAHTGVEDACISCHMATPLGVVAGGHTMKIESEEEGYNFAGCIDCHSDPEATFEDYVADFTVKYDELWNLLVTAGIANPDDYSYAIPGTYNNKLAGVWLNWKYLSEDRSKGVHNPAYAMKLLDNSIAALQGN